MSSPHAAAVIEDWYHDQLAEVLDGRGWGHRIVPHTGYGSATFVRVLGRLVMSRQGHLEAHRAPENAGPALRGAEYEARGWRAFIAAPVADTRVTIHAGKRVLQTTTDRGGFIDVKVTGHDLPPGWNEVLISSERARDVRAEVFVVGPDVTFGVVSDVDDTVLTTSLPRPFIAAWNTFVKTEATRRPVSGMAPLYRDLAQRHPDSPFIYLSTGAWNTHPWLRRFLKRNGYPRGAMLLTDWGPTNTGWFRSGQRHKKASLHRLARELPHVRWLLIGDDGQHDPKIYGEFAAKRPDRVAAIAIRQLGAAEQVLSHGLPVGNETLSLHSTDESPVPVLRAPDGYGLRQALRTVLPVRLDSPPRR